MNRQYLEYIPEIGTPAANSNHGQQQPLHQQPGCKAANTSDHHEAEAFSPWADHVSDSEMCFMQSAESQEMSTACIASSSYGGYEI